MYATSLYAKYLYFTSHASLVTGFYGLYQGTLLGFFPLAVFIASINYWRNPINGFRRYVDIFVAGISAVMQTYYARNYPNFIKYVIILVIGAGFYPLSNWIQPSEQSSRAAFPPNVESLAMNTQESLLISTVFHSMIHIVCNVANYVLYTNL